MNVIRAELLDEQGFLTVGYDRLLRLVQPPPHDEGTDRSVPVVVTSPARYEPTGHWLLRNMVVHETGR